MSHRSHTSLEVSLPENLMFDILSRLPVKAIVTCKCVCKRWRGLVADPYFVDLHLSRSREEALLILQCHNVHPSSAKPAEPLTLKWVKFEEPEHLETVKSLNVMQCKPPITDGFLLFSVGSVNGLVFCESATDSHYIFNPVLEEYMALPLAPLPPRPPLRVIISFNYGFGVSTAGEYKVVMISKNPFKTGVEIHVHTLGTDQWRRLKQTPTNSNLKWRLQGPGVYLNGHLYWLAHDQVYDFDLSSETSELFPYPPAAPRGYNQEPYRMLGVLKGRLSCIFWCYLGRELEVWVRKEESANWYKQITLIKPAIRPYQWRPLCLYDGAEGTSVLLEYEYVQGAEAAKLVAYCLKTNMILNETPFLLTICHAIITYRPSLFKLDTFGSERVHTMHVQPQPTGAE